MMSHLLVALVLLDMLEHGDESLLERRLPKLMVFYNGCLDYCHNLISDHYDDVIGLIMMMISMTILMIPYISTLARRRSSWKMWDVQRSFSARPSMAGMCHL